MGHIKEIEVLLDAFFEMLSINENRLGIVASDVCWLMMFSLSFTLLGTKNNYLYKSTVEQWVQRRKRINLNTCLYH
ncbi:hypothetical protein BM527_07335 [Alteromonas sp. Mex14]|nr:hypothetical protein BM527_07335 [Alteromonas sp. Mex14]